MKKLLTILFVFGSISGFAYDDESGLPSSGLYSNGEKSCDVSVAVEDFYRTGRKVLVVTLTKSKIFPYGRVFTSELNDIGMGNDGKVTIKDGITGEEITLQVNDENKVKNFTARRKSNNGYEEKYECSNLKHK